MVELRALGSHGSGSLRVHETLAGIDLRDLDEGTGVLESIRPSGSRSLRQREAFDERNERARIGLCGISDSAGASVH